jgi:hypothetical protein
MRIVMRRTALMSLTLLSIGCLAHAQGRAEVAPTWTLVEDLRIGGEDEGPKSFSDIRGVAATKNGNIFVLDFKSRVIRLFDAKGNFIKQVSRDGAGPGEIRNANGMAVSASDIVWVNDPQNNRFSLFKSDGSFSKQVLVPITRYGYIWEGVVEARGRVIDLISVTIPDARPPAPTRLAKYRIVDENGKADTVDAPKCPPRIPIPEPAYLEFKGANGSMMTGVPFLPRGQIVHTSAGTVWCTSAAEYSLWSGRIGDPVKEVVNLKVAPLPVSDAERKENLDRIDSLTRAIGTMTTGNPSLIPKTKPVITRVHGDPRGRLWVRLTSTSEATPSFDVFDANGNAVARVNSRGKVGHFQTWITETHVYTVELNEDDVPVVVRYRIVK